MSGVDTFDDYNSTERMVDRDTKPFQFRDEPNSEEKTLEWLNQNFDNIQQASLSRFIVYRRHHALYKGIHWRYNDTRNSDRDIEYSQRKPRHTVNFVQDMTDTKVSDMARFKVGVSVIPAHDEQKDINNAKACKMLLDARAEQIDMELVQQEADAIKYQFGTVFQFTEWDENAGPLHPAYRRLMEQYGGKLPKKVLKKINKKGNVHIGDVSVKNYGPDRVFPELGVNKWEDVKHVERIEWVHVEEVKDRIPKKKTSDISENQREMFDFELTELSRPRDMVMVRHFFHKKTKYLPEGAYIIYCDDAILSHQEFPYDDGELPFTIDRDTIVHEEIWGRSFIGNIEQMQRYYNNIQSAQARDNGIGSAPKWVMPKGSCDVSSVNNEFTIMEFKGPIAPKLVAHNPTGSQSFEIQDRLENKIGQQSKVSGFQQGEVPTGVTANSALRFLDEQESRKLFTQESRRKRRVIKTYRMMIKRMAQYYKPDDGRMIQTLGKNNEYLIKSFKQADFTQVYDVKMENSSALPDTKTGKISAIVDLNIATQTDPVFKKEEIVKMLDMGNDDMFKDEATVAVDAAKTTLELILEDGEYPEPQKFDNFIVFYSIFSKAIQAIAFKMKVPPETIQKMEDYIMTMEGLMFERATKNTKFLMSLMEFDNYPMFFTTPAPLSSLMPVMPKEGGSGGGADTTNMKPPQGETV